MPLTINTALSWLIDVDVLEQAISHVNWDTVNGNSNGVLGFVKQSSNQQNDEINFDVVLAAGTWTVELLYTSDPANGIVTVQFDGVSKGTIDTYTASQTYDLRGSVAGIAVSTSAKVRLKLIMATKNASSSGYNAFLQHVQLRRTA